MMAWMRSSEIFLKNSLSRTLRVLRWSIGPSPEEDEIIAGAHAKYGNKWATIAGLLNGRTDNVIKNHYAEVKVLGDLGKRRWSHDRQQSRSAGEENGFEGGF